MIQYENNQAAKQAQGLTITNPSTIAEILSNPRSLKTYFYLANHGYSELGYTWVDECNIVDGEIVVSTHRMPYLKTYNVLPNDATQEHGGPGWEVYAGAAASVGSEIYYSKTYGTWMGKNFKIYKQTWGGNGATGGKNKFGKTTSSGFKWAGRLFGAYSGYRTIEQRLNGNIGTEWMLAELSSTGVSIFGDLYGAAWGIGWELGIAITTLDAYQEFKFNLWYDRMEDVIGPPSPLNEGMWYNFFNNYGQ